MICDRWISIHFECFGVSRFVACDGTCVIMTAVKNAIVKVAFVLESARACEKRSNRVYTKQHKLL